MPPISRFKRFDVRPLLNKGVQPLPPLMRRLESLHEEDGLLTISPFLPSPLIEKLGSQGFDYKVERGDEGSWMVYFWRSKV